MPTLPPSVPNLDYCFQGYSFQDYCLLGHRGARAEVLENSQVGFQYAQNLTYHHHKLSGVEFDVQLTADHQLVVVHDEHLQRLAHQQGLIYQLTEVELATVRQSDWARFEQTGNSGFLYQPILPLRHLLPYLQGYQHIELEVKTHPATDYYCLAKAVKQIVGSPEWQHLPLTITSFDSEFLTAWQRISPNQKSPIQTGLLLSATTTLAGEIAFLPTATAYISEVCNLACRLGCQQIGVDYALITPEVIAIAHRYGLKVTAWTVNEVAMAHRLLTWGIDTLITDVPLLFLRELMF